ncbi:hypothetical protein FA95DRAFT_103628 [Auriscalpium vulgare]|uniref:Uncharacterized protein n=1 Tax=Auriscalpium vulgare TaxID=40419 RepID=A0ACB8RQ32_9AGAM|nr:hypothetical protein FA95DRAFT_103628 [Auriscalpium vulgare]
MNRYSKLATATSRNRATHILSSRLPSSHFWICGNRSIGPRAAGRACRVRHEVPREGLQFRGSPRGPTRCTAGGPSGIPHAPRGLRRTQPLLEQPELARSVGDAARPSREPPRGQGRAAWPSTVSAAVAACTPQGPCAPAGSPRRKSSAAPPRC